MEANHPTLLLVDDEAGIRRVFALALTEMGYQVRCARDGREALDLFETYEPAIVLADIQMPGMDGIDLLKAIKGRRPDTEVIMITGHGDMDAAILSLKLQATDFITKPLPEGALEIALKRARERIAMRDQLARYTERLERMVEEKTQRLIAAERMAAIAQTVAGLSHTIKHIAGGLRGGAYGVEQGLALNEPHYLRQGWNIVKDNVEKITRLSLDLLNYAKTSQHHKARWCNPNQPLEEVLACITSQAEAARIELRAERCPAPAPVFMDPDSIAQAVLNLAVNAIEAFAPIADERRRTIRLKASQPAGGGVIYHVVDNGCGMDKPTEERLGNVFLTTKGRSGTGIGVMMTRNIVDRHRGDISFRSNPGRGTQAVIRLPGSEAHP